MPGVQVTAGVAFQHVPNGQAARRSDYYKSLALLYYCVVLLGKTKIVLYQPRPWPWLGLIRWQIKLKFI